ncbi:TonB family protein [Myxococcota bacterium]|nr:TonB family protein [Myxococcota bacterium]
MRSAPMTAVALLVALTTGRAEATPPATLAAVFTVERWDADLPGVDLDTLTRQLADALAATSKYQVVRHDELVRALAVKKKEAFDRCTSQACQVEIGRDVGADAAISAQVTRQGDRCTVTVSLMKIWTYWGGKKVQKVGGCGATELARLVGDGARALVENSEKIAASSGNSTQIPSPNAANTNTSTATKGKLSREDIQRTIDVHLARFMSCYQVRLQRRPELQGEVALRFTIAVTGEVVDATTKSSTLQDTAAERCLVAVMQTLKFPPPTGGAVAVTYPFTFTND